MSTIRSSAVAWMVIMANLKTRWGGVIDFALILAQDCLAEDLGDALVLVKGITKAPSQS